MFNITCLSLENKSDGIRWSLDLRWQNSAKENGFYGLKNNVIMKKKDDPHHVIDWNEMQNVNRSEVQMQTNDEKVKCCNL